MQLLAAGSSGSLGYAEKVDPAIAPTTQYPLIRRVTDTIDRAGAGNKSPDLCAFLRIPQLDNAIRRTRHQNAILGRKR